MRELHKAAKWLDAVKPEWPSLVDIENLDMTSSHWCIFGQVFRETGKNYWMNGEYTRALRQLIGHRFNVNVLQSSRYERAWVRAIKRRSTMELRKAIQ